MSASRPSVPLNTEACRPQGLCVRVLSIKSTAFTLTPALSRRQREQSAVLPSWAPRDASMFRTLCLIFAMSMLGSSSALPASGDANQARKPRARDLGIPFEGVPGPLNTITDVGGVEVGHTTLIAGEGKLAVGTGPVRTGVTAILPRGKGVTEPVFAGVFSLNGNGDMTGTQWVEESGYLEGPIMITNTHSVGVVRDAVIAYQVKQGSVGPEASLWSLPLVAETWDGFLNDINGFHVKPEHVFAAWSGATAGPVPEGNVGGGTGMICYEFKGGIGTASRQILPARTDVHGRRARSGEPRTARATAGGGRAGRPRACRGRDPEEGSRLDHHRGRDRCPPAPSPVETDRPARVAGAGANRQHFRQWLG